MMRGYKRGQKKLETSDEMENKWRFRSLHPTLNSILLLLTCVYGWKLQFIDLSTPTLFPIENDDIRHLVHSLDHLHSFYLVNI